MSISCLKCSYSITEPICAACVIKEIKAWLNEQNIKKDNVKKMNSELKYLLNKVNSMDYVLLPSQNIWQLSIMKCIKCKREMHLMCFYCVTNQASKIVKDNLGSESSIENFNESFNTDVYEHEIDKEKHFLVIGEDYTVDK